MPAHWQIRNGPHVAPVLVVADPGWVIAVVSTLVKVMSKSKENKFLFSLQKKH